MLKFLAVFFIAIGVVKLIMALYARKKENNNAER